MTNPSGGAPAEFHASTAYRYYVVWLLFAVYTLNFVDRQIVATLNEPLKHAFALSDTELGMLGSAFALLYSVLGIPIARMADRGHRTTIISVAIFIWSAFTVATGLARNVWQLTLARIGVGIGEAGCNPPAYAIISDYFQQKSRATALSIYSMGVYGGVLLGSVVGSAVAANYGWRMAFYVIGAPGLLMAIVVKLTLRDPPHGWSDNLANTPEQPPPIARVLRNLWAKRAFRNVALAAGLHSFAAYGVGQFYVSFLMRSHHLSLEYAAQSIGVIASIGGFIGTLLGGVLGDFFANRRNDIRVYAAIPAVLLVLNVVVGQIVYGIDRMDWLFALMFCYVVLSASFLAPSIAITHRLVTARERALASALLLLVLNLIGLGLGPLFAGFLSERIQEYMMAHGVPTQRALADGLSLSLRLLIFINLFAAYCYFRTTKTIRQEVVA